MWTKHLTRPPEASRLVGLSTALVALAALTLAVPASGVRGILAALLLLATRLLAAWWALHSSERSGSDALARTWRLLATGLWLWVVADAIDAALWLWRGAPPPLPSLADLPRTAAYLALLTTLFAHSASPMERFSRVRDLLDATIVALAAMTLSWLVLVRPVVMVGVPQPVPVLWSVLVLVIDFALLALAGRMALLADSREAQLAFKLLSLAIVFLSIGDMMAGVFILRDSPARGGFIELSWAAANTLMLTASLKLGQPIREPAQRQRAPRHRKWPRLAPMLSIGCTYAVVGFTTVDWWLSGRVDWLGVVASAALSLLMVARQGVVAGQMEMRQVATLLDAAADLAFICRPDGVVMLSNPAFRKALGLNQSHQKVVRIQDFMKADMAAEALLDEAGTDGWSGEVELRAEQGRRFPVQLTLVPVVDERREEPLLAATAYDLTEVKAREQALQKALDQVAQARNELQELNVSLEAKVEDRTQQLREMVAHLEALNEELKALDRMKSEFVTLVSHELRAPLTNIRSGVELTLRSTPRLPRTVGETLMLVQAETERLGAFVENILDLSSLEAGRFPMSIEPLPLSSVARAVTARLQNGDSRVQNRIGSGLAPVRADETALTSVLTHLLDNALKYASEGPIVLDAQEEEGEMRISVSDCGPGIPTELRQAVFERFRRIDTRDAQEVYGHGLGLYLSRRMLEAMGGRIVAQESEAGGAEFIFWLPCEPAGRSTDDG